MSVQAQAGNAERLDIGAKGVFAAVLGNGFEFFDFTVYATFLGLIGQAFFPSDNALVSDLASAATFGVGFIARPLGGALLGAYGDRAGRRPAMTFSLGLMALGSAMIALTPGYATIGVWAPILLILARLLQGFAVGGEVGPATMFIVEAAPPGRRLFFASWQLASQNLGSLASGMIGLLLALALAQTSYNAWGWRVPFAIGVLIAPVGVYIRSQLPETLDRENAREARNARAILMTVLRKNWLGLLLGLALISGGTITQYFLLTMTPYAIRTLHLPDSAAMLGSVTLGITGALGALAGGFLADRWGIKTVAILPRLLFMIALFPVMQFLIAHPGAASSRLRGDHIERPSRDERGGSRHSRSAHISFRGAVDGTFRHLFAGRGDLRRHGDLYRHVARRRDGQSARLDLLRHGREHRHAARRACRPHDRP